MNEFKINITGEIVLVVLIMLLVLVTLYRIVFQIENKKELVPAPNMAVCKIIIPHGKIEEGWKFWDPADDGHVSNLLRDGKAEIDHLPGLVECTLYPDNQTPVTTSSALAMWRRK